MEELMSKVIIALLIIASFSSLALAQSTSNWQTLTDHKQLCQAKSPQGWETDRVGPLILANGEKSSASVPPAPIGIARVIPQVDAFGNSQLYTFDKVKSQARGTTKVTEVLEDGPARFWVAFDGKTGVMNDQERSYRVHWYVVVPSNPVCAMYVFFNNPALAEQAKLVARSLRGTK
jgi:hypothetical protein